MFSEILNIKPVLDPAQSKKMEESLSKRFRRVARKFGKGLEGALKGTILGISLGLLQKLLNPIQELEDRIKALLGESADISDLADKYGASPGEVRELQDTAQALRVKPEELVGMLDSFAKSVQSAQEELDNLKPGEVLSETSNNVRQFVGRENMIEAFSNFLVSLNKVGQGPGYARKLPGGGTKQLTGLQARQEVERNVFGDKLSGPQRKLLENITKVDLGKNYPGIDQVDAAARKGTALADQQALSETVRNTQSFVNGVGNTSSQAITAMETLARQSQQELDSRLKSYASQAKTAETIGEIMLVLKDLVAKITEGLSLIVNLFGDVKEIRKSSFWRNWTRGP